MALLGTNVRRSLDPAKVETHSVGQCGGGGQEGGWMGRETHTHIEEGKWEKIGGLLTGKGISFEM